LSDRAPPDLLKAIEFTGGTGSEVLMEAMTIRVRKGLRGR
jgi:hypothetical protein